MYKYYDSSCESFDPHVQQERRRSNVGDMFLACWWNGLINEAVVI